MSGIQTIMCVNSGSSSLKFHVYKMGPGNAGSGASDVGAGSFEGGVS